MIHLERMTYYRTFILNLCLMALFSAINPVLASAAASNSGGTTTAVPKIPYEYPFTDPILSQRLSSTPVFIELFTSLDCLFCPRAEKLLHDMSMRTRVVFLACHTDPEGAQYPLGRGVCSDRQARYAERLSDGLMYTPQMVINGHVDAVGHEFDDVALALDRALDDQPIVLGLKPASEESVYTLTLPETKLAPADGADLLLATYRAPYQVPKTMRQSLQRPGPMGHIVDRIVPLSSWDGRAKTMPVSFAPSEVVAGFIVMVQRNDGKIIGAIDSASIITASSPAP